MATGKASDFKVYQDQFQTGVIETLTQNTDAFNDASRGAIALTTASRRGDYSQQAFFANIASLISRRDTTSVAGATDLAMTEDEWISVKLNRKIGPVGQTRDAFRKIMAGKTPEEMSLILGQMAGKGMQVEMLDTALLCARAALTNQAANLYTVPTNGTLATAALVGGLAKFGDAAKEIVCWVMHSKAYYDLVGEQISAKITDVANLAVATAQPVTMNRPVVISDSASLSTSTGSGSTLVTTYYSLGLTAGGIIVENTEEEELVVMDVSGLENLVVRYQGEFAYNLGLRGFKYDIANGGANPTASTLGTGSNWDTNRQSNKDFAGIVIQSR